MPVMTKERNTSAPSMQALRERLVKLAHELEGLETEVLQAEAACRLARKAHEEAEVGEVVGTHTAHHVKEAREQVERHETHLRELRDRQAVLTEGRAQLDGRQFDVEMAEIRAAISELAPTLRTRTKRLGQALAATEAAYLEAEPVAERIQQLINRHITIEVRIQRQGGQTGALPIGSSVCGIVLRWESLFHERYPNKSRLDNWRADCEREGIAL